MLTCLIVDVEAIHLYCSILSSILQVVHLVSSTFNYSAIDRGKSRIKQEISVHIPEIGRKFHRLGLPPKVRPLTLTSISLGEALP